MKNNKGFTLVELLAAIVILGILMAFSLGTITNVLTKSKYKVFVNDAKKMISQSEYMVRSKIATYELPATGNCIVLGMSLFNSSEFQETPYDGHYSIENSFVLIKNIGSEYEYSATIIESLDRGGYMGVKLVTNDKLLDRNVYSNVKSFTTSELLNVNSINKTIINNAMGVSNYCNNVVKYS